MNRASDHFLARIRALEGQRPEWDAAVAELKAIGVTRVTEALLPVFEQAAALATELDAMKAEQESTAWRAELIADVVADLIASGKVVLCGAGSEGLVLYSGAVPPDPATAEPGALYAFVEPS